MESHGHGEARAAWLHLILSGRREPEDRSVLESDDDDHRHVVSLDLS